MARSKPNFRRSLLKTFGIATANDYVDLHAAPTWALAFFLSASITIAAGGGVSGTLLTEHLLRLVDVEVVWDGITLLPRVPAYWLAALTKRGAPARAPRYSGLANSGVQTAALVEAYFIVPFARRWNVNPVETILRPGRIETQFRCNVYWNTAVNAGAGSAAGSGAMIDAGDRVITFATAPTLQCYQIEVPDAPAPLYLPIYELLRSTAFTAANANLPIDIRAPRALDAMLVRDAYGAQYRLQDGINSFVLQSANENWVYGPHGYPAWHYAESLERPGVSDAGTDDLGYFWVQFADGGRLSNALDPRRIQSLQLISDVDAPTSNPGEVQVLLSELMEVEGLTRGSRVKAPEQVPQGRRIDAMQPIGAPMNPRQAAKAAKQAARRANRVRGNARMT